MEGWVVPLTAVTTATGDLTQVYPSFCPAGVNPAVAVLGDQIRQPLGGKLYSTQIQTDGTNGGIIELWDVNGEDIGANVSSATTITNAQLVALQALGKAKLIYSQNFQASPITPFNAGYKGFAHGIAARFIASAGVCNLDLSVGGGFFFRTKL